jgi:VIT1/CCC1 family predicted Fe2+/Mn2+ transporter
LTREELGIDPDEKGGSPVVAALSSFALFSVGAIIPVLPFFFWAGTRAIVSSAILSSLALFLFGATGTIFTGKPVWFAGTRQLLLGLLAACITFELGHLLGVGLS